MSQKLQCTFCGHDTKVLPWKPTKYGGSPKRRRECLNPECRAQSETLESVQKVIRQPLKRSA